MSAPEVDRRASIRLKPPSSSGIFGVAESQQGLVTSHLAPFQRRQKRGGWQGNSNRRCALHSGLCASELALERCQTALLIAHPQPSCRLIMVVTSTTYEVNLAMRIFRIDNINLHPLTVIAKDNASASWLFEMRIAAGIGIIPDATWDVAEWRPERNDRNGSLLDLAAKDQCGLAFHAGPQGWVTVAPNWRYLDWIKMG
jgi:hypothetical protein